MLTVNALSVNAKLTLEPLIQSDLFRSGHTEVSRDYVIFYQRVYSALKYMMDIAVVNPEMINSYPNMTLSQNNQPSSPPRMPDNTMGTFFNVGSVGGWGGWVPPGIIKVDTIIMNSNNNVYFAYKHVKKVVELLRTAKYKVQYLTTSSPTIGVDVVEPGEIASAIYIKL